MEHENEMLMKDLTRFHEKNVKSVLGTDADMETYKRIYDLHRIRVDELKVRLDAEVKADQLRFDEARASDEHELELKRLELEKMKIQIDAEDKEERRKMEAEKTEFERSLEEKRTLLDAIKTGATVVGAFFTGCIGVWEFAEMLNFEETGSIRSTVGRLVSGKWGKNK